MTFLYGAYSYFVGTHGSVSPAAERMTLKFIIQEVILTKMTRSIVVACSTSLFVFTFVSMLRLKWNKFFYHSLNLLKNNLSRYKSSYYPWLTWNIHIFMYIFVLYIFQTIDKRSNYNFRLIWVLDGCRIDQLNFSYGCRRSKNRLLANRSERKESRVLFSELPKSWN